MMPAHLFPHPTRPIASTLGAALLAVWGAAALASDLCSGIKRMTVLAGGNFASLSDAPMLTGSPAPLPPPADCALTHALGGIRAYHCVWEFGYRVNEATEGFKALDQSVQTCSGDGASPARDQPVNHPDYYDLRQYVVDGIGVNASIKDKIALGKTFVFLRIEGKSGN